jgi:hypothetical protein
LGEPGNPYSWHGPLKTEVLLPLRIRTSWAFAVGSNWLVLTRRKKEKKRKKVHLGVHDPDEQPEKP